MPQLPEWNTRHIKPEWTVRRIFRYGVIGTLILGAALTFLSAGATAALIWLIMESPVIYAVLFPKRARAWCSDVTPPGFADIVFGAPSAGMVHQRTLDDQNITPVDPAERNEFDRIAHDIDSTYTGMMSTTSLDRSHPDAACSLNAVERDTFRELAEHYDD